MAAMDVAMSGTNDFELPARKKPKISELPLSSAQRASIDSMLHTFKKKGEFDALRKKAFQQYNESAQRGMFENALRTFTTNEIERDSLKYLRPQTRIAAPLLEGAAARADIYVKTEQDIDAYIDQYVANAEKALRDIRRQEIGDEAAAEEYRRGRKSDEDYAGEAEQRRHERAEAHVKEERKRKKQEIQERRKEQLEALKKKQEALQKETERLQREQKRRAERDAWKTAEKERERERLRKYNEERENAKKEAEERERVIQEERERRQKERAEREQKRLEAEALDMLLREGQQMAEKARRPELERSESMEPPQRLKHQSGHRTSYGKDQMRAQGLMPTSLTLRKGDKMEAPLPLQPIADRESARDSRPSRLRSPSQARSSYSNRRRDYSPDDRRPRRDKRDSLYRDISTERGAWRARARGSERDRLRSRSPIRDRDRDRERDRPRANSRGEEGEVVERAARSRSPNIYRPRRDDSRSPPRRTYRERTRSRSPARRHRDRSRRRERSRSPPGIDRYVPGGAAGGGRPAREDEDAPRPRRSRDEDDEREKPREREKSRDRDRDRASNRRRPRYEDRDRPYIDPAGDRYVPGGGGRGSTRVDEDERTRRRDRSRSRERDGREGRGDRYVGKGRGSERERDRERDRDRKGSKDEKKDEKKEVETEAVEGPTSKIEAIEEAPSKAEDVEEASSKAEVIEE